MGKKQSTIENRVYLMDKLGAALLAGPTGAMLASGKEDERARALRALADIAHVSCVIADGEKRSPEAIRGLVREDESVPRVPPVPNARTRPSRSTKTTKTRAKKS